MATLFSNIIPQQAEKYGDKIAYRLKDEHTNQWIPTSWNQFSKKVVLLAKALEKLGVKVQDNVAICSQNKPEILISEYALYTIRAVSVPLYATSSTTQIEYILTDAEISFILVGEQEQYDVVFPLLSSNKFLKQIVIFDQNVKVDSEDKNSLYFEDLLQMGETADNNSEINKRTAESNEEDLATLIYTSGTTGVPKGVMLTHSNFTEAVRIHEIRLDDVTDKDVSISFLPMSHIFEKMWCYYCLIRGVRIEFNLRPMEIQKTLQEIRPTLMCSVPRLWEKIYAGVEEKMEKSGAVSRFIMKQAIKTGKIRNLNYIRLEKRPPFLVEARYKLFEKLVFTKLKKAIGIENGNFFPVAGAPLADHLNEFFHACGIEIRYGYGLTETTASVSTYFKTGYVIGSVGVEMPGLEVKIGEDNEILVKGKTIMKGYYKKPVETAEVMTADGWFKTGDAGTLSENGVLTMTERIKDLIKTSNGKYVAPQALELKIGEDKFIDQIAIIGDEKKFITALIIPAYEALKEYAATKQIQFRNMEELIKHSAIHDMIVQRINARQKDFATYEQVKKFTLLPYPFTLEGGELTNTLKLKRKMILQKYNAQIEEMYR
ncbi:MAG: long-chain fatty acid--CoA ligase [Bacteroidales bacterium]|nr:long-chain fatty acid--CoA ligase [Bacteroidales bacterium]